MNFRIGNKVHIEILQKSILEMVLKMILVLFFHFLLFLVSVFFLVLYFPTRATCGEGKCKTRKNKEPKNTKKWKNEIKIIFRTISKIDFCEIFIYFALIILLVRSMRVILYRGVFASLHFGSSCSCLPTPSQKCRHCFL